MEEYLRVSRAGWFIYGQGRPEPVPSGRNTVVVRLSDMLRGELFVHAWRCDRALRPAREHVLAAKLLADSGLWAPEVIFLDDSWATLRRWRLECVIERAARGHPLSEGLTAADGMLEGAALRAVARAVARLHATTGPAWGKPWRSGDAAKDPILYWRGRLEKMRVRVPTGTHLLEPPQIETALKDLERRLERMEPGSPALCHGDLSTAHLFFDAEEQRVTWIDFGSLHYGHPARDLAAVAQWPGAERWFEAFLGAYGEGGGRVDAPMRGAIDLFARLWHWERLSSRIVKRVRHARRRSPQRREQLLQEQRALERKVQGFDAP